MSSNFLLLDCFGYSKFIAFPYKLLSTCQLSPKILPQFWLNFCWIYSSICREHSLTILCLNPWAHLARPPAQSGQSWGFHAVGRVPALCPGGRWGQKAPCREPLSPGRVPPACPSFCSHQDLLSVALLLTFYVLTRRPDFIPQRRGLQNRAISHVTAQQARGSVTTVSGGASAASPRARKTEPWRQREAENNAVAMGVEKWGLQAFSLASGCPYHEGFLGSWPLRTHFPGISLRKEMGFPLPSPPAQQGGIPRPSGDHPQNPPGSRNADPGQTPTQGPPTSWRKTVPLAGGTQQAGCLIRGPPPGPGGPSDSSHVCLPAAGPALGT